MYSVTACRRWTFRLVCSVLVMSLVSARTIPVGATDLAKQYPATLDFSKQNQSYDWQTGPQDVWRLESFVYQLGDQFQIKLGPSQVVLGKNGSNVLWAAVYPDQPGDILKASGGQGDHNHQHLDSLSSRARRRAVPRRYGRETGRCRSHQTGSPTRQSQTPCQLACRSKTDGALPGIGGDRL